MMEFFIGLGKEYYVNKQKKERTRARVSVYLKEGPFI